MNDSIVGINQSNKIQVLPQICDVELEPVKITINKVDDSNRLVVSKLPSNEIETIEPPSSLLNRNHESFHNSTDFTLLILRYSYNCSLLSFFILYFLGPFGFLNGCPI